MIKVFLGCDHGGFDAKKEVIEILESLNCTYEDLGAHSYEEGDDYPIITKKVCQKVLEEKSKNAFGVLICGSGVGVAMAANRIKGIRAVQGYDSFVAKYSRLDEDANVITLRSREFDHLKFNEILRAFLETNFSDETRHKRRIGMLEDE